MLVVVAGLLSMTLVKLRLVVRLSLLATSEKDFSLKKLRRSQYFGDSSGTDVSSH